MTQSNSPAKNRIIPFNNINEIEVNEIPKKQVSLPYPNGWFAVCFSHELKVEQVIKVPFSDQDLVIYRTKSGVVYAIDPYCPHMGAHLAHGGKIKGEDIICPFHGLKFNQQGKCDHFEKQRRSSQSTCSNVKLKHHPVREMDNVIFVWRHSLHHPPEWEIPNLNQEGFSQRCCETFLMKGLSQDMTENSADPLHFSYLHGLKNVTTQNEEDGEKMIYTMKANVFNQDVTMRMVCYGVGYAVGEAHFAALGLIARTQALGTQITPLTWIFRMIDTIRIERIAALPKPLHRISYFLLLRYIHYWFVKTVKQDFDVWSHRCFLQHPNLMNHETNMMAFRRWSSQFYTHKETQ